VSRLLDMLRDVIRDKHPSMDGREPVRQLIPRLMLMRPVRLPRLDGMVPVRQLLFSVREVRPVRVPIRDGTVPVRQL
jgi:hypothetical protein